MCRLSEIIDLGNKKTASKKGSRGKDAKITTLFQQTLRAYCELSGRN